MGTERVLGLLDGLSFDQLLDVAAASGAETMQGFDDAAAARASLRDFASQGHPLRQHPLPAYTWRQNTSSLLLTVPAPPHLRATDVRCNFGTRTLQVSLFGRALLPSRSLPRPIRAGECRWWIEDGVDPGAASSQEYPSRVFGPEGPLPEDTVFDGPQRCLMVSLAKAEPSGEEVRTRGWWLNLFEKEEERLAEGVVTVAAAVMARVGMAMAGEGDAAELDSLLQAVVRPNVRALIENAAEKKRGLKLPPVPPPVSPRETVEAVEAAAEAVGASGDADLDDLWDDLGAALDAKAKRDDPEEEEEGASGERKKKKKVPGMQLSGRWVLRLVLLLALPLLLATAAGWVRSCAGRSAKAPGCGGVSGSIARTGWGRTLAAHGIAAEHAMAAWTDGGPRTVRITAEVWVGGLAAVWGRHDIVALNASRVVAVTELGEAVAFHQGLVEYHHLPLRSPRREDFADMLVRTTDFIAAAATRQERVLVHSHRGTGRAAVVVAAHLVRHRGMSVDAALARVEDGVARLAGGGGAGAVLERRYSELTDGLRNAEARLVG
eukprot:Hpha_TRINITY_DN3264_c0_g1::TRINITY_DN3264_c0_g1_i2::g.185925::m.185925